MASDHADPKIINLGETLKSSVLQHEVDRLRAEVERLRIKAELRNSFDGIGVTESQRMTAILVYGLCDRAMAAGRQRVPLIEQRDRYQRERDEARAQAADLSDEVSRLRATVEQLRARAEAAELRSPSVLTDGAKEATNG